MAHDDARTSLDTPQPNELLDAYRRQILAAHGGVDDAYWLTGLLSQLLDTALTALDAARSDCTATRVELEKLTARVAALEPPLVEPPAADPEVPA